MKETLKEKITTGFKNLMDFDTIIKAKGAELEQERLKLKEGNGEDLQEKLEFYKNVHVDMNLFNIDVKMMFDKLFFLIQLYFELGYDGLSAEVMEFYKANKIYAPTEVFIVKDGNLIEKEEGFLEEARKRFIENNDFIKNLINANG